MDIERKKDLSVYYFISDVFANDTFITIVDGFPVQELTVPSVSVESGQLDAMPFEMGNTNRIRVRVWYVDVFATNKTQRDEMAYKILDYLEDYCIDVYNYDEGYPPDVSPTRLGCIKVQDLGMKPIRIHPELVDKLYYRTQVDFTGVYNQI